MRLSYKVKLVCHFLQISHNLSVQNGPEDNIKSFNKFQEVIIGDLLWP